MADSRFIIGIDLGTTNSALAYIDREEEVPEGAAPAIHVLAVEQLAKPGVIEAHKLLPSFMYLPPTDEREKLALDLPWGAEDFAVGVWARERGAERPGCLVSSAKSWLCHAGVDRKAAILPWQTAEDVAHVSPLDASARYLSHLRHAFDHAVLGGEKKAIAKHGLAESTVILTIPASFDAVARELTSQAAQQAGLKHVTLLEEPQAAFYAWIHALGEKWREQVGVGDMALVCDIGGGTTDFSLIAVSEREGTLALERVAVGEHTLVGGDNMDLLLAHTLRQRIEAGDEGVKGGGKKLDTVQFLSLVRAVSRAKEKLLAGDADSEPISILGRGSKLIGGAIKTDLSRADVEKILVEGFFPECELSARPDRGSRLGLREVGLPYAQDAAVTKHLAEFLSRARSDEKNADLAPTHVLFNGGVMKATRLRQRVVDAMNSWFDTELAVLAESDLDLGAAIGAATFGLTRASEKGIRIRGGVAQTYYLGIASAAPAVPGVPPPVRALCVCPFGTEEGNTIPLPSHTFELIVGEAVEFPFLAAPHRKDDTPGQFVDDLSEIAEIARLETAIDIPTNSGKKKKAEPDRQAGDRVPVTLEARVTEIGTLEVFCVERDGDGRWKLEINVRATE